MAVHSDSGAYHLKTIFHDFLYGYKTPGALMRFCMFALLLVRRYCYVDDFFVRYTMETAPFLFERPFN